MGRLTPPHLQAKILAARASGLPLHDIARRLAVPYSTVQAVSRRGYVVAESRGRSPENRSTGRCPVHGPGLLPCIACRALEYRRAHPPAHCH